MLIFKNHHLEVIEQETAKLLASPDLASKKPFEIVANWAKYNLGRHLQTETIQQAEALPLARLLVGVTPVPTDQPVMENLPSPPLTSTSVLCNHQRTLTMEIHRQPAEYQAKEIVQLAPTQQQTECSIAMLTEAPRDWSKSSQHNKK